MGFRLYLAEYLAMQKLIAGTTKTCCINKHGPRFRVCLFPYAFGSRQATTRLPIIFVLTIGVFLSLNLGAAGVEPDTETPAFLQTGPAAPQNRHNRVENAVIVSPETANEVYHANRNRLNLGYARHQQDWTSDYYKWKRANAAPYPSFSHGRRFLNNYVNTKAEDYLRFENARTLPKGAVIAKNSFSIAADGTFVAGPLFLMEKMETGFNYLSGDWRYSLISANGELVGKTKGPNAAAVKFCITCHLAREKSDHLFFLPRQYR